MFTKNKGIIIFAKNYGIIIFTKTVDKNIGNKGAKIFAKIRLT
jgi:hypothetical protein